MDVKPKSRVKLFVYFASITGLFTLYSLIQERLMTQGFGLNKEKFTYSVFIVFVNRLVTCAVASLVLVAQGESLLPAAPVMLFSIPSIANVIASSAQYEALKYVSFPLQALAKCAKTVPVILWSLITKSRTYRRSEYSSALIVTLGCTLFVLTGNIIAPHQSASQQGATGALLLYGTALLAVFLFFDGLTSTSQDKLFSSYSTMSSSGQLLYVTWWSAMLSGVFLLVTGQFSEAFVFIHRHPSSLIFMLIQSIISTAVQLFIVFTIKEYGALQFALIMTLRQFLSIVASCIVFGHSLTLLQWMGCTLVIGGLIGRTYLKKMAGALPLGKMKPGLFDESSKPLVNISVTSAQSEKAHEGSDVLSISGSSVLGSTKARTPANSAEFQVMSPQRALLSGTPKENPVGTPRGVKGPHKD